MNTSRYIIRGIIDGSLSVMGVVIGAYNPDFIIIISAGMAGAIASGFSNFFAAFSAEHTTHYRSLRDLEHSMLTSLKNTQREKEISNIVRKSAFIDGISTIVGGIIPLIPFFFLRGFSALILSIVTTFIIFLFLGVYIGKLSKNNIILSSLKLIFFAAFTAGICFIVTYFIK